MQHKKNCGFTLVETLISLLVMSMVTASIVAIIRYQDTTFSEVMAASQMNNDLRRAARYLTEDIRKASAIMQLPETADKMLRLEIGGEAVSYYLQSTNGTVLYREVETGHVAQAITRTYTRGTSEMGYLRDFSATGFDRLGRETDNLSEVEYVEFTLWGGYGGHSDPLVHMACSAWLRGRL